jgi:hypothetical protein
LIDKNAHDYIKVTSKYEKTKVIVAVIETIRCEGPGGFVKKDFYSGRWYKIGDEKARDKVGHAIRKAAEELEKKSRSRTPKGKAKNAPKKAKKDVSSGGAREAPRSAQSSTADNNQQAGRQSTQPAPLNSAFPTLSSLYEEDDRRIAHSWAIRQHPPPEQHMVADWQIMPSFAGPAARYEAPQAYLSNHLLGRRSLPASSTQVSTQSNLLLGGEINPGMAPAFSGLTQSSLRSVGHSTTLDATSAYQLAALRELGIQQWTPANSRLNPVTMVPLTSAVNVSLGGLGHQFIPQSQLGMLLGSNLPSADTSPTAGRIQPTGISSMANECLSSRAPDKARSSQSDSD